MPRRRRRRHAAPIPLSLPPRNIMAVSNDDICHSKACSKSALKMPPVFLPLLTEAAAALLCPLITKCVFLRRVICCNVTLSNLEGVRGTNGNNATSQPMSEGTSRIAEKPRIRVAPLETRHLRRNSIWYASERANGACNRPLSPRRIYNTGSKYTRASFLSCAIAGVTRLFVKVVSDCVM